MDPRKKEAIIEEAHSYLLGNWILTEAFIGKIKELISQIKTTTDLSDEYNKTLDEVKTTLKKIEADRPSKMSVIKLPTFFSSKQLTSAAPQIPPEIQEEILSYLSFHERKSLSTVCTQWNTFFQNQVIGKKFLFPKNSGGIVLYVENKKPSMVKELLSLAKDDLLSEISYEIHNRLYLTNNEKIRHIERESTKGVDAFYKTMGPLLIIAYFANQFGYYKILFAIISFICMGGITMRMENNKVAALKSQPKQDSEKAAQFLKTFKK